MSQTLDIGKVSYTFEGVHDKTKNYEKLSIVSDGFGNTYFSIKDVPTGISLSNQQYWTTFAGGEIPIVFNTIEDMLNCDVKILRDGLTCIVKDKDRGGIFIYDSSKIAENDGGVIFNGWVRQYDGVVNVKWFGTKGDGITDDTEAIQNALNFIVGTSCKKLIFTDSIYKVFNTIEVSNVGSNKYSNIEFDFGNSIFISDISNPVFIFYRVQGAVITGLTVKPSIGRENDVILKSMWFTSLRECNLGKVVLSSEENWGFYWNSFYSSDFSSIHFDITNYSINQNIFNSCKVGSITKSDAFGTFKEAYNNVFIGCDIVGSVDWTNNVNSDRSPLIFENCNFEFSGNNKGYLIIKGLGRENTTSGSLCFPFDRLDSEIDLTYNGGKRSTGWQPFNETNLISGGAGQTFSDSISIVSLQSIYLGLNYNSEAPFPITYKLTSPSSNNYGHIKISIPKKYIPLINKIGSVSFSFWVKDYVGNSSTLVHYIDGDIAYVTGHITDWSNWTQIFTTVRTNNASDIAICIGRNRASSKHIEITGVCATIGRKAIPYVPAVGEKHPDYQQTYQKNIPADDGYYEFLKFKPINNSSNKLDIKAIGIYTSSYSNYEKSIYYSVFDTDKIDIQEGTERKSCATYSDSAGGIKSIIMEKDSDNNLVIKVAVNYYSNNPSVKVRLTLISDKSIPDVVLL